MISQGSRSVGGQLFLQFPPLPPRIEVLQLRQLIERFGNLPVFRKTEVGKYLEHQKYRILHKGRDRWEVIRID